MLLLLIATAIFGLTMAHPMDVSTKDTTHVTKRGAFVVANSAYPSDTCGPTTFVDHLGEYYGSSGASASACASLSNYMYSRTEGFVFHNLGDTYQLLITMNDCVFSARVNGDSGQAPDDQYFVGSSDIGDVIRDSVAGFSFYDLDLKEDRVQVCGTMTCGLYPTTEQPMDWCVGLLVP